MNIPSNHIRRITIDQLQPGMFLSKIDRSWIQTPFFFHKRVLKSTKDIEQLRACGVKEVWIDLSRGSAPIGDSAEMMAESFPAEDSDLNWGLDVSSVGADVMPDSTLVAGDEMPRSSGMPTGQDFQQTRQVLDDAVKAVEALYAGVKSGAPIQVSQSKQVVCDLLEQVARSETALLHLIRLFALKNFDSSLYQHAIEVCVMAILLGVEGGLTRPEVEDLGVGALLHDIGYVRLPGNLLRKRVPLSRQEQLVLDCHTDIGCEIVSGSPDLPHSVKTIISEHHERLDGSGHPRGAMKHQLSQEGRMVAIVDHYHVLVTERWGRWPLVPAQAIRELYRLGQLKHLDPEWVDRFIRVIGVYPVGSLVELSSGERAVVAAENPQDNTRPCLYVIKDPHSGTFSSLDLGDVSLDPSLKIVGYLNPDKEKIDLAHFLASVEHPHDTEAAVTCEES